MATRVLRRDSQVEFISSSGKRVSALDQERFAAKDMYQITSLLGTPVRLQSAFPERDHPELVGAIVAVNKYRDLRMGSALMHDKDGFSEVDKELFTGIAEQLGMALKLAIRQAIVQTAQEEHVQSIVSATSVIVGMYAIYVQCSRAFDIAAVEQTHGQCRLRLAFVVCSLTVHA
jgi:GAF domain-containing protein